MYTKYCTLDLNSFWEIHCLSIFPYKSLTYQSWPCHKLGQGHCKVIICTNYDGPACPMLHTKFQGHRPFGSGEEDFWRVFTIYGRGGHLGHVTQIPGTNFRSPDLGRLHMKYGFNRPSGFRGEDVWKCWRRTDGRTTDAWLYYKLTYEPKGSGELKASICSGQVAKMQAFCSGRLINRLQFYRIG